MRLPHKDTCHKCVLRNRHVIFEEMERQGAVKYPAVSRQYIRDSQPSRM
jgi:hypothetical protein